MTRQEFLDSHTDMYDLKNFCETYNLYVMDNYVDDEDMEERYDEIFTEMLRHQNWRDVRDAMYDAPTGYDWYYIGEYGDLEDFRGCDDSEFEYLRDEILGIMDMRDGWDEEEEPEDEPEVIEEPVEPCIPDEEADEVDISGFLSGNIEILHDIEFTNHARKLAEQAENNEVYEELDEDLIADNDALEFAFGF